jgi:hypothetical protein
MGINRFYSESEGIVFGGRCSGSSDGSGRSGDLYLNI